MHMFAEQDAAVEVLRFAQDDGAEKYCGCMRVSKVWDPPRDARLGDSKVETLDLGKGGVVARSC